MTTNSIQTRNINKVSDRNGSVVQEDYLAIEGPLEIRLEWGVANNRVQQVVSVTMRTPGNDAELALGFLFTEGIIGNSGQVAKTSLLADDNKVLVQLQPGIIPNLQQANRNFYMTSSCGVCGKSSVEAIKTVCPFEHKVDDIRLDRVIFYQLASVLSQKQALFNVTGGLHASALFTLGGDLLLVREDVGRHNALDKLIGALLLAEGLPLSDRVLLLSGRASFELIQKAAMAGIRVVASIGAPSSLAVELADESGMTLVGFLRSNSFNVYSGLHRVGQ